MLYLCWQILCFASKPWCLSAGWHIPALEFEGYVSLSSKFKRKALSLRNKNKPFHTISFPQCSPSAHPKQSSHLCFLRKLLTIPWIAYTSFLHMPCLLVFIMQCLISLFQINHEKEQRGNLDSKKDLTCLNSLRGIELFSCWALNLGHLQSDGYL